MCAIDRAPQSQRVTATPGSPLPQSEGQSSATTAEQKRGAVKGSPLQSISEALQSPRKCEKPTWRQRIQYSLLTTLEPQIRTLRRCRIAQKMGS
jgi:hypothetical protein